MQPCGVQMINSLSDVELAHGKVRPGVRPAELITSVHSAWPRRTLLGSAVLVVELRSAIAGILAVARTTLLKALRSVGWLLARSIRPRSILISVAAWLGRAVTISWLL